MRFQKEKHGNKLPGDLTGNNYQREKICRDKYPINPENAGEIQEIRLKPGYFFVQPWTKKSRKPIFQGNPSEFTLNFEVFPNWIFKNWWNPTLQIAE